MPGDRGGTGCHRSENSQCLRATQNGGDPIGVLRPRIGWGGAELILDSKVRNRLPDRDACTGFAARRSRQGTGSGRQSEEKLVVADGQSADRRTVPPHEVVGLPAFRIRHPRQQRVIAEHIARDQLQASRRDRIGHGCEIAQRVGLRRRRLACRTLPLRLRRGVWNRPAGKVRIPRAQQQEIAAQLGRRAKDAAADQPCRNGRFRSEQRHCRGTRWPAWMLRIGVPSIPDTAMPQCARATAGSATMSRTCCSSGLAPACSGKVAPGTVAGVDACAPAYRVGLLTSMPSSRSPHCQRRAPMPRPNRMGGV